jgi:hypothetical protein
MKRITAGNGWMLVLKKKATVLLFALIHGTQPVHMVIKVPQV